MKTSKIFLTTLLALLGITIAFGDTNTEKFKVYGNCGMCEKRIEKAANAVEGVTSSDWDKDTKQMVVVYDNSKTSLMDIEKAIAAVGHDTDMVKADDEAYNALPSCCQYDRSSEENSNESSEHGHQHNH
jgi:mercuric ion binding protein